MHRHSLLFYYHFLIFTLELITHLFAVNYLLRSLFRVFFLHNIRRNVHLLSVSVTVIPMKCVTAA